MLILQTEYTHNIVVDWNYSVSSDVIKDSIVIYGNETEYLLQMMVIAYMFNNHFIQLGFK